MQAQLCADYGQLRRQPVPTSFAPQLQDASSLFVGRTSAGPVEGQHSPDTLLAAEVAACKEGELAKQRAYALFLAGHQSTRNPDDYTQLTLSTRQAAPPYDAQGALPPQLPQQGPISVNFASPETLIPAGMYGGVWPVQTELTAMGATEGSAYRQQQVWNLPAAPVADVHSKAYEGSQYGVGQQGLNPRPLEDPVCRLPPQLPTASLAGHGVDAAGDAPPSKLHAWSRSHPYSSDYRCICLPFAGTAAQPHQLFSICCIGNMPRAMAVAL